MKRSGFKRPTYEEALQKAENARERQRARAAEKMRQTGANAQTDGNKPKSLKQERAEKKAEKQARELEFTKACRRRDRDRCQFPGCNVVERPRRDPCLIQVHHKAPRSRRKDLLYVVSNGVCLCNYNTTTNHHGWVHDHPIEAERMGLLSFETRELAEKQKLATALDLDGEVETKPSALSFDSNSAPSKRQDWIYLFRLNEDSPLNAVPAAELLNKELDISDPLDPEPLLVKILRVDDSGVLYREIEVKFLCNST